MACLTIQEVTSLLIREILAHNQRTYEELAYINPLLIENDLVISPKNSWMISLKHGRFSARAVGADEVIARLLIPVNANITAGGIQYNNLFMNVILKLHQVSEYLEEPLVKQE